MKLIGWMAVTTIFFVGLSRGGEIETTIAPSDIIKLACHKPLLISNIRVNRERVLRYNKFEITFDLQGRWDNPFDPDQVKVDAEFISPNGKVLVVPGFFYQEYLRTMTSGEDSYEPVGNPMWKVRFSPSQTGEYSYRIKVVNGEQMVQTDMTVFTCSPDTVNHGFVRVSGTNPLYLEYDDGTPFFALATCKWWDKLDEIEPHYVEFARAGGNMTRNFLSRIGELVADKDQYMVPSPPRSDRGFGKIDLDRAWRHDQALELCEQLGISQQLAIANGTYFLGGERLNMLVYNKVHGGPLSYRMSGEEYLTNPVIRKNFKLVLRYFVARWAYSTAVFSWNLWNEINLMKEYDSVRDKAKQWHQEMGQYLKDTDWADHVVHTNFNIINGDPMLDSLDEMDIVSVNTYTQKDFAPSAELWIKRHLEAYHKPVMFSEFGIGHSYKPKEGYAPHDPERIMAHNGMWITTMSESAGTGLAFGWNWLKNEKYYSYLNALAKYVDGVPFSKRMWQPVTIESFHFSDEAKPSYYADTYVEGWFSNYKFPEGWKKREVFKITPDGHIKDRDYLSGFLGGPGRNRVVFEMEYPEASTFTVFVTEIFLRQNSPGPPELTVLLDGQVVIRQKFDVDPEDARRLYRRYTLPVSAGAHSIAIENTGGGFMPAAYELGGFVHRNGPDLQVRGMQTDDIILLWLKAPKLTWLYSRMGIEPEEQPSGKLVLAGVPDGVWIAEWLDTIENKWIQRTVERATNGKITLKTPPIQKSVAVRLFLSGETMTDVTHN